MEELLYIVIPVYNEQEVIAKTFELFDKKLNELINNKNIGIGSKLIYVDDGSTDDTWKIINSFKYKSAFVGGVRLSCNRGHQNALIAGLSEVVDKCDLCITIDCDGQDDINAIDKMIDEYRSGSEIVYGIREDRKSDTFLKRVTAESYYKFLKFLGCKVIYNHADYRLMSTRSVHALLQYDESNLYIRGIIPMLGFKTSYVEYTRQKRIDGETHYSITKMMNLAINGITNLSIRPLRIIIVFGLAVALISIFFLIWAVYMKLTGNTVSGWSSLVAIVSFLSGVQLLSIGVIAEYVGKIYLETKHRPKYFISERL